MLRFSQNFASFLPIALHISGNDNKLLIFRILSQVEIAGAKVKIFYLIVNLETHEVRQGTQNKCCRTSDIFSWVSVFESIILFQSQQLWISMVSVEETIEI